VVTLTLFSISPALHYHFTILNKHSPVLEHHYNTGKGTFVTVYEIHVKKTVRLFRVCSSCVYEYSSEIQNL